MNVNDFHCIANVNKKSQNMSKVEKNDEKFKKQFNEINEKKSVEMEKNLSK